MRYRPYLLALLLSALVATGARSETSSRKVAVEFSKGRAIQGLYFDDKVELVVDRASRRGSAIIRGRFSRPNWRLMGGTKKTSDQLLVVDNGNFELSVPVGSRLELSFSFIAVGPGNVEQGEDITLTYVKATDPLRAKNLFYTELTKSERASFNGSFFRLAPLFSFFSIDAVDNTSGGQGTFVSSVNMGVQLQLSPLATRFSPILTANLLKMNLPAPASKTIDNNSAFIGSVFAGALWWLNRSRSLGVQFGMNVVRQPFILATSTTTLVAKTVDLLRPEVSAIVAIADSHPYSAHFEAGGRYTLRKQADTLLIQSGFDGFVKVHTARTMVAPYFLGVRQLHSAFGVERRMFTGDIVNHTVQEITFQIGIGW